MIFDKVKGAGAVGHPLPLSLFTTREARSVHIWQLNGILEETDYRIVHDRSTQRWYWRKVR